LGTCVAPCGGVILPEDAARWEANHGNNEWQQAQRQRRQVQSATQAATRAQGEETLSDLESLGDGEDEEEKEDEEEEDGEITPSPLSPPPEDRPSLSDLFNRQAEISVSVHWSKHPWMGIGASSSPPPQSGVVLVTFDL
jgi:hypothetical protein